MSDFYTLVLEEAGFRSALYGLGLSYDITAYVPFNEFVEGSKEFEQMRKVALKLKNKNNGENKFLESMYVSLLINAPRAWWVEFDTYRTGITKQSQSTMHTLLWRETIPEDYYQEIVSPHTLEELNNIINSYKSCTDKFKKEELFHILKMKLPEGYMQKRQIATNYKTLQHIHMQRKDHRLIMWKEMFPMLQTWLDHPEFIFEGEENAE